MLRNLKRFISNKLRYVPLVGTTSVRTAIDRAKREGRPYCPPDAGDLLFTLVRANGYRRCLETGFHTGSSALYLLTAIDARDGDVTSICVDDDETVAHGLQLLEGAGFRERHRLMRVNSNRALPELLLDGEKFDLIFMDGWKTFDHLAFEVYAFNQLLETGGTIVFDDAYMPSVRMAIRLLVRYYDYEEIDYLAHNQSGSRRLFQILTRRSLRRPYRALTKTIDTNSQAPFLDWHFFRRV